MQPLGETLLGQEQRGGPMQHEDPQISISLPAPPQGPHPFMQCLLVTFTQQAPPRSPHVQGLALTLPPAAGPPEAPPPEVRAGAAPPSARDAPAHARRPPAHPRYHRMSMRRARGPQGLGPASVRLGSSPVPPSPPPHEAPHAAPSPLLTVFSPPRMPLSFQQTPTLPSWPSRNALFSVNTSLILRGWMSPPGACVRS